MDEKLVSIFSSVYNMKIFTSVRNVVILCREFLKPFRYNIFFRFSEVLVWSVAINYLNLRSVHTSSSFKVSFIHNL